MEDKKEKVRFIIEKNYELRGKKILVVFQASGHRCGYVGVPKGHPLYGVDYNAISDIEVHGGLTYSDIDFYNNSYANSNYWLLGFDCAHCWDKKDIESLKKYNLDYKRLEEVENLYPSSGEVRTNEYVEKECLKLLEQIEKMENHQIFFDYSGMSAKEYIKFKLEHCPNLSNEQRTFLKDLYDNDLEVH